jgi:hypothetical protein
VQPAAAVLDGRIRRPGPGGTPFGQAAVGAGREPATRGGKPAPISLPFPPNAPGALPANVPPQVQQTPVVPGEQYRPRHVKVQTSPDRWAHHRTLDARGAHRACPASRFNSRETCAACQ